MIASMEDDLRADAATVVPPRGSNEKADLVRCRVITSLLLVTVMETSFTLVKKNTRARLPVDTDVSTRLRLES